MLCFMAVVTHTHRSLKAVFVCLKQVRAQYLCNYMHLVVTVVSYFALANFLWFIFEYHNNLQLIFNSRLAIVSQPVSQSLQRSFLHHYNVACCFACRSSPCTFRYPQSTSRLSLVAGSFFALCCTCSAFTSLSSF